MWKEVFKELWRNKEHRRSLVKALIAVLAFVFAITFLIIDKIMYPKHIYPVHVSHLAPFAPRKDILITDSFPSLTEMPSDTPGVRKWKVQLKSVSDRSH